MSFEKEKISLEIKKIWKPLLGLFLVFLFIFNWPSFSWLFTYRFWQGLLPDFSAFSSPNFPDIKFEPAQTAPVQEGEDDVDDANDELATVEQEIVEKEFEYSEKENILEIPSIEISPPFFIIESTASQENVLKLLDKGVVLFSDSARPGTPGQTIIIGHGGSRNWPKTNPAWVFTYLKDIKIGDEIFLHFEHKKYPYSVTNIFFVEKGAELPTPLTNSENMLLLVSCWPPGKATHRIVVEARLKN